MKIVKKNRIELKGFGFYQQHCFYDKKNKAALKQLNNVLYYHNVEL